LTDDECLVTSILPDTPLGHSDHTSIVFTLSVSSMRKTVATDSSTRTWYLWHKSDYDNMARFLDSINWSAVLCDHPPAERMWNVLIDILWSAITVFVPTRVSASRHKPYHMKSRDLRKCAARKRKLWRKMRINFFDPKARSEYRQCVHMWRQILRKHQIVREQSIVEADNLGAFYEYVKQRISNRTSINAVVEN